MESSERTTEFLTLLTQNDRALGTYVYCLVPANAGADDILQQTKMIMWRCFDRFELCTNFLAWACKIAFHQILAYRRERKHGHLPLNDDVIEALSHEVSRLAESNDHRREALQECLRKLPSEHRQLVLLRYFEDLEVAQIAARISSTVAAVYRALSRVRLTLLGCVEKQKAAAL